MANTIKLKKSSVTAKVPLAGDLDYGELAINYTDGNLFFKTSGNTVTTIASTQFVSVTGNITGASVSTSGNILTAGLVSATGNVSGNYFLGNGALLTGISGGGGNASSITNGTSNVNIATANGNVVVTVDANTAATLYNGGVNVPGAVSAAGNITGSVFSGNASGLTDVPGANVTGTVANATFATSAGSATAVTGAAQANITSVGTLTSLSVSGNVDAGNVTTAGLVNAGSLTTSGNAIIGGDLVVNGNTTYINITDLNVEDPIIGLGRGPNNTPLVADDGKDRGEQLWYYDTAERSAFIGWDDSAAKLIAAANVSIANEIVTVNSYGTFVVGTLEGTVVSATGNITGSNLSAGFGFITGASVSTSGNILTAGLVSATGNIAGGNIQTGGIISATGNITGGNLITSGVVSGTSIVATMGSVNAATTMSAAGNITGGNLRTSGTLSANGVVLGDAFGNVSAWGNVTGGNVSATGNITGGNLNLGIFGQISTGGNIIGSNITVANGNVTSTLSVIGNITGGNLITSGSVSTSSIGKTGSNGVGNIGSSTNTFNTVFAKATSAQYADLAEIYAADASYAPGTVVVFGGRAEVTRSTLCGDTRVVGVVSCNPAYIMNAGLAAEHAVAIALQGRVPTSVVGSVQRGDLMVTAPGGAAQACARPAVGTVIGKAIESSDGESGVIEILVGRT